MLPFDAALERVLALAQSATSENIPMTQSVGRFLFEDLRSDRDLPPFDYRLLQFPIHHRARFPRASMWMYGPRASREG